MIIHLEQEKEKYATLEDEYRRFSRDASREQERLTTDIRVLRSRFEDSNRILGERLKAKEV